MHVHFVAVSGTGMGSLAGLVHSMGHDVSGSDVRFDPPMGPALKSWGVRLLEGFDPAHLSPAPDLVVVGNVCRKDNPEARAAIDSGLRVTDMAHALAEIALVQCSPLVVAGTHGKTTTTAICAWLLHDTGMQPGFLIGGIPKNFSESFHAPAPKRSRLPLASPQSQDLPKRKPPFVVEGDEYDTAFFEKTPKFWHYLPEVAIITSIEHDHIDIYPTLDKYLDAFIGFVQRIPSHGLIVASSADKHVVDIVTAHARCPVAWFGLQSDAPMGPPPEWMAAVASSDERSTTFDLYAGGVLSGRCALAIPGDHNVRNALAAIAVAVQGFGVALPDARAALARFEGVKRRQDLIGTPRGVFVYDDFAHHPTAVEVTLAALRARHRSGRVIAVFEPRSATACRSMHQQAYGQAFGSADIVLIAPLGRSTIDPTERLDLQRIVDDLRAAGKQAQAPSSIDEIVELIASQARGGDVVALLSNGAFGGIHARVLEALSQ